MKKFIALLLAWLGYRFMFCYTIPVLPHNGGQKHKIHGVYYFPEPHTFFFNPFQKATLRKKITDYAKANEYDRNSTHQFLSSKFLHNYFESFKTELSKGNFELVSLKYEKPFYHILVCDLMDSESTIVFKWNPSIDRITEHY